MEKQTKHGDDHSSQDITAELLSACEYMIEITGGSQHWRGETNKALKKVEAAIARAKQQGGKLCRNKKQQR